MSSVKGAGETMITEPKMGKSSAERGSPREVKIIAPTQTSWAFPDITTSSAWLLLRVKIPRFTALRSIHSESKGGFR